MASHAASLRLTLRRGKVTVAAESLDEIDDVSIVASATCTELICVIIYIAEPRRTIINKTIDTMAVVIRIVLIFALELICITLYAKRIRGGKDTPACDELPSILSVPRCVAKPILQLGAVDTTVTSYGELAVNCFIPGQLTLTVDGGSLDDIKVYTDTSLIWLFRKIALLVKSFSTHASEIDPDSTPSKQSLKTFECRPSKMKEKVSGLLVIRGGKSSTRN